jgi:hypothetical protein
MKMASSAFTSSRRSDGRCRDRVVWRAVVSAGIASAAMSAAAPAEAPAPPARLAIYYGIPSLVNGAGGDVERAARVFVEYDVVVFGDGLEYDSPRTSGPSAGPVEHARTRAIVTRLAALRPATQVFGYVPLGDTQRLSWAAVADGVRRWRDMGIHGIFLDEVGYDFGVTRERQTQVIDLIHSADLRVFANAFNPDDILGSEMVPANARGGGNPLGLPSRLGPGDLLLLESFIVRMGELEQADSWFERARKAAAHSRRTGIGVMTVTTTHRDRPFDAGLCQLAWWGTVLWGFQGFGWGEADFAAPSSQMPLRACAADRALTAAGHYVSEVEREGPRFVRRTQYRVLEIDFARRSGRLGPGRAARPRQDRPRSPTSARQSTAARTSSDAPRETGPR